MRPRGLAIVVAIPCVLGVVAGHGAAPAGDGSPAASPATLASPAGTPLPLYTQIPVNQAVNVVGRLTIQLTDRGFIPSRFECAVNENIVVTLVNVGGRLHNFSIGELGVHVDVPPGQTKTVTIKAPPRLGHYTYYSGTPEDRALGMTGTMTIFI